MHYGNYQLLKTWLHQCLKSCVSQDASTDNMANASKHGCNVYDNTFTRIINHSAGNSNRKSSF